MFARDMFQLCEINDDWLIGLANIIILFMKMVVFIKSMGRSTFQINFVFTIEKNTVSVWYYT